MKLIRIEEAKVINKYTLDIDDYFIKDIEDEINEDMVFDEHHVNLTKEDIKHIYLNDDVDKFNKNVLINFDKSRYGFKTVVNLYEFIYDIISEKVWHYGDCRTINDNKGESDNYTDSVDDN